MMKIEKPATQASETSIVRQIMFQFIPYWPLFLVLFIFSIFGGWLYLRYSKPSYEITSTIMIKDQKKGVDDPKFMDALNVYGSSKLVENEIEIIHSRALMSEVVNDLHLYAPVSEEGTVHATSAYASSPVIVSAKDPDHIREVAKVYFTFQPSSQTVTIANKDFPLNKWVATPYGELQFQRNPFKTELFGKPLYFSLVNPKKVTNNYLTSLDVSSISKVSTVVTLKLRDEVPRRGEDILNALGEAYTRASLHEKDALSKNTITFLDERIRVVEEELGILEKRIQNYKSKKGIVDLSAQGKLFLENVGSNDRKLSDINIQIAELEQVEQYVVSKDNKAGMVPSTLGVNDPVLLQLLEKLYNSELEYDRVRKSAGENNPLTLTVAHEIEKIRPNILENIQSQKASLVASRSNLSAANGSYASMIQTIPQQERELLDINRQQSIKNSVYTFLLQKREETGLSFSSTEADNRVIDTAQSSLNPVSPKKPVVYLAAVILSIGLGFGYIVLRELLNNKILFRTDIENFTSVPVVAELTKVRSKHPLVVHNPAHIGVAEQFRQVRANMGLYDKTISKKKLLITSGISGEGKSFVSANLALSLALSGKKVVLLDLDIRNPKTSHTFNIKSEEGIGEYLMGTSSIKDIILPSEVDKNLFVIGAGRSDDNPTELLLNGRLNDLFAYLEPRYDYIIVDSSPIGPITDAFILSEYCDATLYVVRHGCTPKNVVQMLDSNNKVKGLKNITIIFNGVKSRGFGKGEFGYGYGYGYGYEYVYKEQRQVLRKTS